MNDRHVLVYVPKPGKPGVILARGTWEEAQERWLLADDRLRRVGWPGYVAVRSADDPWCAKWPRDMIAARLATRIGDRVELDKYGNTYSGTVRQSWPLSVAVAFGTTSGVRVVRLPLLRPARWGRAYRHNLHGHHTYAGEVLIGETGRAQVLAAHL